MNLVRPHIRSRTLCLRLVLLFAAGLAGGVWSYEQTKTKAVLDSDGRGFTFSIPSIMTFKGSFSATFVRGAQTRELLSTMGVTAFQPGQTQVLNSVEGILLAPPESFSEETPHGRATGTEVALRFARSQLDLLVRFSQVPGVSGFQVQTGVRNSGPSPVRLLMLSPVVMEGRVEGNLAKWLVTALDKSVNIEPPMVALSELSKPVSVLEYGGLYSSEGQGFLFGPVGTPCAYVQASIAHKGEGNVSFTYTAEMSGVQVKPGETRWGQQVALFAEAPRKALVRWTEWVSSTHKARTDKGALSGWSSFSFHGFDISGQDVLDQVAAVDKTPHRLRPMVMEIDRGYQDPTGQNEANEKFPQKLSYYAERIAATGARPGIYLNYKGVSDWNTMADRVSQATKNGFTYMKISQAFFRIPSEVLLTQTSLESMRNGFSLLKNAAGEKSYILFQDVAPNRATVGLVDANCSGTPAERTSVRSSMNEVLRSYHLNGRWFAMDNSAYYMGTDIANVSEIAGGWPLVRTWMSMIGLSCGAAITADPWHWESFQPYWRNVEVMAPPAREETVVLDLCTAQEWSRLLGHVKRAWGDQFVALLWNPGTTERKVTLDFARAGMDPRHRYAVWSYWENRYLGVAMGSWTTPALGPSASQHLCFTDLDCTPDKPMLIGSDLHIYCGAAEIKRVSTPRGAMKIELTDAGAREGDLFIYSRRQPVWKAAEGCGVAEIASAGEYVWRIHLVERLCGAPQWVMLEILLPVTHQIWFWALIGTVLLSLLLAAWRYVTALRLQREHILEQDRGRIARDIHDDLGSSLTQIALLSELAQADSHEPEAVSGHVNEIFTLARTLTRSVDEIVWAVNPANDTVEKFAAFVGQYVERFARTSGLACQLEIPDELPARPMESALRHHLFLAVKEALHNVVAHAKARTVRLDLSLEGSWLKLVITDDGQGFTPDEPGAGGPSRSRGQPDRVGGGQGLASMRQRMVAIAGKFEISSTPGQGTSVTLKVKVGGRINV